MNKTLRCAVYTRKSCEEGLELAHNSLESQRMCVESYVRAKPYWSLLPKHYDDGGFSGGTTDRPALKELFEDIKQGLIDVVVVYKMDRLARSVCDLTNMIKVFDQYNVTFESVTEPVNTTTTSGRLILHMLGSVGEYEREVTSDRIRDKVATAKQKGLWTGGNVPLGYDVKDKQLIQNPQEAALIQHIFQRFLVLRSPLKLAKELNESGYKARLRQQGQFFNKMYIRRILTNPIYKGDVRHKDKVYTGQHQAIIDQALWDQTQAIFQTCPHARGQDAKAYPSLLKQRLRCKACDVVMTPTYTKKRNKHYRYYVRNNHVRGKACTSVHTTVAAGEIESVVTDRIRQALKSPAILGDLANQLGNHCEQQDVVYAQIKRIDSLWDYLFPIEQQHICHLMIDTVWFHDDGVQIQFKPDALMGLIQYVRAV